MRRLKIEHKEKLKDIIKKAVNKGDEVLKAVVLYMIAEGRYAKEIAKELGISERGIRKWAKEWNEKGRFENSRKGRVGRKGYLTKEQEEELKRILKERDWWRHEEIRELIKEKYGVEYSKESLRKLLRRLGMRYVKPLPTDYRRPMKAEEILRGSMEVVMREMEEEGIDMKDVVVGFLDETSPELRSNTQRVWTYREQVRIRKNTADRYRANVIGFYAINGESVEKALERTTGEEVAKFLEDIKEANREKRKIVVVLDNFPAHKSEVVRKKAEELGIRLVYLPPYSPDLNPIEWIFKSIKRVVSVAFVKSE